MTKKFCFVLSALGLAIFGPVNLAAAQELPKEKPESALRMIKLPSSELNNELVSELTIAIAMTDEPKRKIAFLQERAKEHMKAQLWLEAAEDYLLARDVAPDDSMHWMRAALLLQMSHKTMKYDQLAKEMLEKFGATTNPYHAERTAKMCWFPKFPVDEKKATVALANLAVKERRQAWGQYFPSTRALGHYRYQEYGNAIALIDESNRLNSARRKPQNDLTAINDLLLAMSLANNGEHSDAKKRLEQAAKALRKKTASNAVLYADDFWNDWLLAVMLYEEAKDEIVLKIESVTEGSRDH